MKIIISPAKSLDFKNKALTTTHTEPQFLEQSVVLNKKLKSLSRKKLSDLMKISKDLSDLNYERNQKWQLPFSIENAKQAVYAFTGDVYKGIDVASLDDTKISVLQDKLRIISGLYGILKPLDLIQPYRLEMGTRLQIGSKENLYKFWGNMLTDFLNEEMNDNELLINLASNEYFKAIQKKKLKTTLITPHFKDLKNGEYKTIMTFAKKARGFMVRYIIDNKVETLDELKGFNTGGYGFSENLSSDTELVFVR